MMRSWSSLKNHTLASDFLGEFMEFWVTLIGVHNLHVDGVKEALEANCTHVLNDYYIFEGSLEYLENHYGVEFSSLGEGAVPSLGDMDQGALIHLCFEVFGIDVTI